LEENVSRLNKNFQNIQDNEAYALFKDLKVQNKKLQ
jgi:hypothetical protein